MAISPKFGVRQSQQLTMSPQLRQAIQLLQFNATELQAFVASEIESNPLLDHAAADFAEETAPPPQFPPEPRTGFSGADASFAAHAGQAAPPPTDGLTQAENFASQTTLREHLRAQAGLVALNRFDRSIVDIIIEELDDDGYMRTPLPELASRLGVPLASATAALTTVQSLDPTGVGARDLAECLRLQLADAGELGPAMDTILDNLGALTNGSSADFAATLNLEPTRVADALSRLRQLDPSPGLAFETGSTPYAVPEVAVTRNNLGGWSVELLSDLYPKVTVNTDYTGLGRTDAPDVAAFVSDCKARAKWLVNSLNQRGRTLQRVAAEVVRLQEGFFSLGIEALRPLTLREVADNLDMHESTVSRVTNGKYLTCDRGTFELKFFFPAAIRDLHGEAVHASASIRQRIRRYIENEPPAAPLSDEALAQNLMDDGIVIARRTVSKYREAMKIASSAQRRRDKTARTRSRR